ncbi:MAG TPA: FAD-dependent oxidoreductase [Symbiobacteriaceae bacterium]|jgi:phytoene dehydrogenase-like protein|nr:FAD-dependent oxidoreductase [Symbiobacteriaceae bacterium]
MWDAVVVGAGCSGLATAALLSHGGLRVLVLEKGRLPGGRAPVLARDGFQFNLGIHTPALGPSGPLYSVLRAIGKADRVRFVRPVLNNSWVERGARLHRMILQPWHLLTTSLLTPGGKVRLGAAVARLAVARPDRLWDVPLGELGWGAEVREYFFDQAQVICFEAEPEQLSAGHFVEAFQATLRVRWPFFYPQGGWGAVYQALTERIVEAGGEVRLGARVTQVSPAWPLGAGAGVTVHLAGAEPVQARACVLTLPPQDVPALLPDGCLAPDLAAWLQGLEPVAVAALDLGLKQALPGARLSAVHSPAERMLITSYTDPAIGLTPPGGQLIQALCFARPGELEGGASAIHRQLEAMVERHFPGAVEMAAVRQATAFRRALSVRRKVGQARVHLPGARLPGVPTLFLAGDGTAAPGELGNAAWASARGAAAEVLRFLGGR